MDWDKKLILDDGSEFRGCGFGGRKDVVCELVFNTSMALATNSDAGRAAA